MIRKIFKQNKKKTSGGSCGVLSPAVRGRTRVVSGECFEDGIYKEYFNQANDIIQQFDLNGRLIDANKKWFKTLGYTKKESKTIRFRDVIHPDFRTPCLKRFASVSTGGNIVGAETAIITKDGRKIPMEASASPFVDDNGNIVAILSIFRDITERKMMEKEMEDERDMAQKYLDIAGSILLVINSKQKIELLNKRGRKVLGCVKCDPVGRNWFVNFVPKKNRNKMRKEFDSMIRGGSEIDEYCECSIVTMDGRERLISWSRTILKDDDGKITGVLSSGEDITEKRLSETRMEKYINDLEVANNKIKTILYNIGDGVFVVDKDYNIILFNKMASKITGFSVKSAVGKKYNKVLRFVYEDGGSVDDGFIKNAMKIGRISKMSRHVMLVKKNKEMVPVSNVISPIKSEGEGVVGCVVVFRDITEERSIDRAKTEFVSLASHQLRTPLSAINWYTEMLLGGDAGNITKKQKDYLSEVYNGSKRMSSLVNALLNVSRIELGAFSIKPEPTKIKDIVVSVLKELKPMIVAGGIKVSSRFDKKIPTIKLDRKLIRIVLQNILSNAVKYSKSKGSIRVGVKRSNDSIIIRVSDSGYGIPKNQQSKIFTKLFRADNIRGIETTGTGLGLYIVKAILDNTDGKIWFKSAKNKGATFYVQIPLSGMKKKTGRRELISVS